MEFVGSRRRGDRPSRVAARSRETGSFATSSRPPAAGALAGDHGMPVVVSADDIRDERRRCCGRPATRSHDVANLRAGQYRGYREENGVKRDSQQAHLRRDAVQIDNWRWMGVRSTCAPARHSRAVDRVTSTSRACRSCCSRRAPARRSSSVLTLRIQPHEGISLRFRRQGSGREHHVGNVLNEHDYAERSSARSPRPRSDCCRLHARDATLFKPPRLGRPRVELIQPGSRCGRRRPACSSTTRVQGSGRCRRHARRVQQAWGELTAK